MRYTSILKHLSKKAIHDISTMGDKAKPTITTAKRRVRRVWKALTEEDPTITRTIEIKKEEDQ